MPYSDESASRSVSGVAITAPSRADRPSAAAARTSPLAPTSAAISPRVWRECTR